MKNQKGITLLALTVTIIVLMILAGITIKVGTDTIQKAKLESLKTNMLLLQGKLKTYAEDAKFNNPNKTEEELKQVVVEIGTKIQSGSTIEAKAKKAGVSDITGWYYFTEADLEKMGLKDIQDEEGDFIVKFDIVNATVKDTELIYTSGWKGRYTLKAINELE